MKLGSIYNKPVSVQLDPRDGSFEPCPENEKRMVSHLSMMFSDQQAVETILKSGDRLVYEIRYYPFLTGKSDMVLGTTMILPGKIGNEYHMTKGHFHEVDNQPEIYHCVQGEGILQMMTLEGEYLSAHWIKDTITHIPPQYAHRVINTCSTPLIYVASFHVAAGHNYGPIIDKGFKYIVVEQNGVPFELLNPRWK